MSVTVAYGARFFHLGGKLSTEGRGCSVKKANGGFQDRKGLSLDGDKRFKLLDTTQERDGHESNTEFLFIAANRYIAISALSNVDAKVVQMTRSVTDRAKLKLCVHRSGDVVDEIRHARKEEIIH